MDKMITDEQQKILDDVAEEKRQESRMYANQEYMYGMLVRMGGHEIETKRGFWVLDADNKSGGIFWVYDEGQMTLWCTPFWEAAKGIPIALDIDSIPFDTDYWYRTLKFGLETPLVDVQNFLDIIMPVLFEAEDLYRVLLKQNEMEVDPKRRRMSGIVDDVMDELREVRSWLDEEGGE